MQNEVCDDNPIVSQSSCEDSEKRRMRDFSYDVDLINSENSTDIISYNGTNSLCCLKFRIRLMLIMFTILLNDINTKNTIHQFKLLIK